MNKNKQINILSFSVMIGFFASVVWCLYNHYVLRLGYPYDTFLFHPSNRFMDFFNSYDMLKVFTYVNQPLNCYFPLTFWIFYPFTLLKSKIAFVFFNIIFFAYSYAFIYFMSKSIFATESNRYWLNYIKVAFLVFFSFPFLMCVDRGNIEVLLFIFLSLSMLCLYKEKYNLAALLLVAPTGMKLYPGIFALMLLKKRKFKSFFLFIFLLVITAILAMFSLHGGIAQNMNAILKMTTANLGLSDSMDGVRQTGSVMAIIKVLYVACHPGLTSDQLNHFILHFSKYYSAASLAIVIASSICFLYFQFDFWKQIMLLTLLIILLPQISFDYKFIHFFIPLAFFLRQPEKSKNKWDVFYLICFIILLIPKNYHIFPLNLSGFTGDPASLKVSISIFVDVFIMISFFITILTEGIFHQTTQKKKLFLSSESADTAAIIK